MQISEPGLEFKGSIVMLIWYIEKEHPTFETQVDLILQPRKFKVFTAIGLNRLSGLQTPF